MGGVLEAETLGGTVHNLGCHFTIAHPFAQFSRRFLPRIHGSKFLYPGQAWSISFADDSVLVAHKIPGLLFAGRRSKMLDRSWKLRRPANAFNSSHVSGVPTGRNFFCPWFPAMNCRAVRSICPYGTKRSAQRCRAYQKSESCPSGTRRGTASRRSGVIAFGSAVVSTAVFGVPPKTFPDGRESPFRDPQMQLAGRQLPRPRRSRSPFSTAWIRRKAELRTWSGRAGWEWRRSSERRYGVIFHCPSGTDFDGFGGLSLALAFLPQIVVCPNQDAVERASGCWLLRASSAGGYVAFGQIDPEPRKLFQLGFNQPLEGASPIAGYLFYYLNEPNFIRTNLTLRLAVAPVEMDTELGNAVAFLGPNTDLGFGLAARRLCPGQLFFEFRKGQYIDKRFLHRPRQRRDFCVRLSICSTPVN